MNEYEQDYFKDRPMEQKYWTMSMQWIRFLKLDDPDTMFDYGCGMGYYIHCFKYFGIDSYGFDISKFAGENGYGLAEGRITNDIKSETNKYSLVLCIDVLEHLEGKEIDDCIDKLISLSDKYILMSICMFGDPNFERDPTHKTLRTKEWWTHQFAKRGLKQIPTPEYFLFNPQFLIFGVAK